MRILIFLILFFGNVSAQTAKDSVADTTAIIPFEGQITADSRLEKTTCTIADTVLYTIVLSWKGSNENYMFWPPETPQVQGLEFAYMQTMNEKKSTNEGYESRTTFKLYFVPTAIGESEISEAKIKYLSRGAKEVSYLYIKSQRIKITSAPRQLPTAIIIKLVLILLLAGALGYGYYRIRRQRLLLLKKEPVKTPAEKALHRLNAIKIKRIEGNITDYYHEISLLLKELIIDKKIIAINPKSIIEAISLIEKSELSSELKSSLKSAFNLCEEIRFSHAVPEAEKIDFFETKIKDIIQSL